MWKHIFEYIKSVFLSTYLHFLLLLLFYFMIFIVNYHSKKITTLKFYKIDYNDFPKILPKKTQTKWIYHYLPKMTVLSYE